MPFRLLLALAGLPASGAAPEPPRAELVGLLPDGWFSWDAAWWADEDRALLVVANGHDHLPQTLVALSPDAGWTAQWRSEEAAHYSAVQPVPRIEEPPALLVGRLADASSRVSGGGLAVWRPVEGGFARGCAVRGFAVTDVAWLEGSTFVASVHQEGDVPLRVHPTTADGVARWVDVQDGCPVVRAELEGVVGHHAVDVGDLDGDGHLDAAFAGPTLQVVWGPLQEGAEVTTVDLPAFLVDVAIAPPHPDQLPHLVTSVSMLNPNLARGAAGTWLEVVSFADRAPRRMRLSAHGVAAGVGWADVDVDGLADLISAPLTTAPGGPGTDTPVIDPRVVAVRSRAGSLGTLGGTPRWFAGLRGDALVASSSIPLFDRAHPMSGRVVVLPPAVPRAGVSLLFPSVSPVGFDGTGASVLISLPRAPWALSTPRRDG